MLSVCCRVLVVVFRSAFTTGFEKPRASNMMAFRFILSARLCSYSPNSCCCLSLCLFGNGLGRFKGVVVALIVLSALLFVLVLLVLGVWELLVTDDKRLGNVVADMGGIGRV